MNKRLIEVNVSNGISHLKGIATCKHFCWLNGLRVVNFVYKL